MCCDMAGFILFNKPFMIASVQRRDYRKTTFLQSKCAGFLQVFHAPILKSRRQNTLLIIKQNMQQDSYFVGDTFEMLGFVSKQSSQKWCSLPSLLILQSICVCLHFQTHPCIISTWLYTNPDPPSPWSSPWWLSPLNFDYMYIYMCVCNLYILYICIYSICVCVHTSCWFENGINLLYPNSFQW